MSYTPNNSSVFEAAYSGGYAGMVASGKYLRSQNEADYDVIADYAGAWAESFDTVWGVTSSNLLQLDCIRNLSAGVWQERTPFPVAVAVNLYANPATWTAEVTAIIAAITAAGDFFTANGIPIPSSGGSSYTPGVNTYWQTPLPATSSDGLNQLAASGTITNLDNFHGHTPAVVEYGRRVYVPPIGGANETAAFYGRLESGATAGQTFQYCAYFEIPTTQNFTRGGSATKVIHRGHGDAHFVGILNGINPVVASAITNTIPATVTATAHGFAPGDIVQFANCTYNGGTPATVLNGVAFYGITYIDANTFSIPNTVLPFGSGGVYDASSGTVQDIDPPVGYEGATWGDGTTSFLASKQGGPSFYCGNWTGFNALYQDDPLLNYALFNANECPNNAHGVNKRIGLADSFINGRAQFTLNESGHRMINGNGGDARSAVTTWSNVVAYTAGKFVLAPDGITYKCILGNTNHQPPNATYWQAGGPYTGGWDPARTYTAGETVVLNTSSYVCILGNTNQQPPNAMYWTDVSDYNNYGLQRIGLYNSGDIVTQSLLASAATPLVDSPIFRFNGSYWNGAAPVQWTAYMVHHLAAASTPPQADFRLYSGAIGSETARLIWDTSSPVYFRIGLIGPQNTQTANDYDSFTLITTTNAGALPVDTAYSPPDNHSATVRVQWNVKDTSNNHTAGGETICVIRRAGGVLTIAGAGAATSVFGDAALGTAAVSFLVSVTNTLEIVGNPPGAYVGTLDWVFHSEIVEN